jgi:mRNA-degrading endonuclease RelE of RelBE toxin-antitoxin system
VKSWTGRGAATRVYSPDFDADFSRLSDRIQRQIEEKLNNMGLRLADYPHYRLTGSSEYRFRIGDHRVIYQFDVQRNEIHLLAVGNRDKIYKRV